MLGLYPQQNGQIKPPPGTQINWGHPFAAGLCAAIPFNEGAGSPYIHLRGGLLRGTTPGSGGNPKWSYGPSGPSMYFNSGFNQWWDFGNPPDINAINTQGSIVFRIRTSSISGLIQGCIVNKGDFGETTGDWAVFISGTTTAAIRPEFAICDASSNTTFTAMATSQVVWANSTTGQGFWRSGGFSWQNTGSVVTFAKSNDGRALKATPTATAIGNITSTTDLFVGDDGTGAGEYQGDIDYIYIFNQAILGDQMNSIIANPFAIFEPSSCRMFSIPTIASTNPKKSSGFFQGY